METRLIFVHALSPLHAGTGQGTGVIDLPIAREKATGLPYLPGSSLKGTLRTTCRDDKKRLAIFGPDTANASEYAGAVQITDLRLLLLPVRSWAGTFAWVTSPYVLRRFFRDVQACGATVPSNVPDLSGEETLSTAMITDQSVLVPQGTLFLEDLDLTKSTETAQPIADWLGKITFPNDASLQTTLKQHLCIVHDDVFSFLLDTATEVVARIRLNEEAKTVEKGGLWYEEALPAETILAGLVVAMPNGRTGINEEGIFTEITEYTSKPMQLGGKTTVGRGLCRITLSQGASND